MSSPLSNILQQTSRYHMLIAAASAASAAVVGAYVLVKTGKEEPPLFEKPENISVFVQKEDDFPEYDVVIVGGGTAGCVLASRLSENPSVRVLLLEAGDSARNVPEATIPAAYGKMLLTERDWALVTEPQVHADSLAKRWPRGKMLGGCSSINAMMFHAGAPTDYDEWAQTGLEGAEQWSFRNFQPYFRKFEKFIPSKLYPIGDVSVRGTDGPITTGFFGHLHDTCAKWIKACENLGIPYNDDINHPTGGTMGVTKIMTYIDQKGHRVTTEKAYLTSDVLKRPNLKVVVRARAHKVLFETISGKPKAIGVEFTSEGKTDGRTYRVRAKQEVIVSAGAVHSPHILLLSGIGPKEHLAEHNIPVVHHLPGVGQNLYDHVHTMQRFRVKDSLRWVLVPPQSFHEKMAIMRALLQWKFFGTGPFTTNLAEAAAFTRADDLSIIGKDSYDIKDETSGPGAPDLETIILPLAYPIADRAVPETGDLVSIATVLLRPQSKGSIRLRSNNPNDAPVVDPQYLSTKNDVSVLVRGLKLILRIVETEPFASVIERDDDPLLDHRLTTLSDAELEKEIRKRPETLYHPTSSCRMASLEDGGVVDANLRVHGVRNLRVVDASVFPTIPAGHTAAPVIAVAEKASDLIKKSLC